MAGTQTVYLPHEQRLANEAHVSKGVRSPITVDRGHRSRGSRSGLVVLLFATAARGFTTAARGGRAATAARATTAAAAAVMTVMVMMATAASATAAFATAAAAATMTGNGHFFTADEGDADDRDKHRDA
jgi:hypothetical protein